MNTTTTATETRRHRSARRPAHDGPARPAARWRVTDPVRYARYIAALETLHAEQLAAARDWLGVEVFIGASGRLVVRSGERVASEALCEESLNSPSAFRAQIVALSKRVA